MPKSPFEIILLAALAAPAGAVQSIGSTAADPAHAAARAFDGAAVNAQGGAASAGPNRLAGSPIAENLPAEFERVVGPAPEPAAWALMMAGFGLVGWAARRRRPIRPAAC